MGIHRDLPPPDQRSSEGQVYRTVMQALVERGTQGIILGCTEISMRVRAQDASAPLFDTTAIHASAAAELALALKQQHGQR